MSERLREDALRQVFMVLLGINLFKHQHFFFIEADDQITLLFNHHYYKKETKSAPVSQWRKMWLLETLD